MQNISKYTASRHLFLPRFLNTVINRDEKIITNKIFKFWNKPENSNLLNRVSYQVNI